MKGDRAVFDCRQAKNKMGHSFAVHEVTNFTNLWSFHWFSGFCALWSVNNLRIKCLRKRLTCGSQTNRFVRQHFQDPNEYFKIDKM